MNEEKNKASFNLNFKISNFQFPILGLKYLSFILFLVAISALLSSCNLFKESSEKKERNSPSSKIVVFSAIVNKPALEEVAKTFERETDIKVELHFGGSGEMLSQMITTKKGDLYIPASSDFLELAKRRRILKKGSEKVIAYLVPAIFVQKGNPKKIRSLMDLKEPEIKVAIADPKVVAVGRLSLKIFRQAEKKENQIGLAKAIEKNIITYGRNAEGTMNLLVLKQVDAIINWTIYQRWYSKELKLIPLDPKYIPEISNISLALSRYSKNQESAKKFAAFLTSKRGKAIYKKHGYQVEKKERKKR